MNVTITHNLAFDKIICNKIRCTRYREDIEISSLSSKDGRMPGQPAKSKTILNTIKRFLPPKRMIRDPKKEQKRKEFHELCENKVVRSICVSE
jgi:hypothetical protein